VHQGPQGRPQRWCDVDRAALVQLLSSGLTPAEVGALYGRDRDRVHGLVRRWGLDSRALRARAIGLAAQHPDIAAEFVEVVDGAPLTHGPQDLLAGSGARCRWRCTECQEEWVTSVCNRTKRRSGCPACSGRRALDRARARPAASLPLGAVAPDLGREFTRNLSRPDRDLHTTLVVEADLLCDLDTSRWHGDDSSVARDGRKLERLAGLRYVRVRPPCLGLLQAVAAPPEQQVLLDGDDEQDPWLWAAAVIRAVRAYRPVPRPTPPSAADRAAALTRADLRWRRLRTGTRGRSLSSEFPSVAEQLVEVPGRPELTAADLAPSGDDRAVWQCPACGHRWEARVANRTVLGTGCPPCSYRRGAALAARPRPGSSFADEHPDLVRFFIEDETAPGRTLADLRPGSTDRCRWHCPHCGRLWIAAPAVLHRNPGAGCRTCGYHRSARARAGVPNAPDPGDSCADRNPHLVEQFVENLTHPGVGLDRVRPKSRAVCLWRCRHCGRQWQAPVHARTRHPGGGCGTCVTRRGRPGGTAGTPQAIRDEVSTPPGA
jgi:hypothetical protein